MLSKSEFFLGKIPLEKVFLKHDPWYKENNIELIAGRKAVRLDTTKKIVMLNDGVELNYEKLLLAIGSCSRKLDIPGVDKEGVFVLRTISDAKALMKKTKKAKHAIAIGGGFTNFEICNLFRKIGLEAMLVIREPHFWDPVFDKPSGEIIEKALEKLALLKLNFHRLQSIVIARR
jgi:NAD(P)H-nitrite reductase large subunit